MSEKITIAIDGPAGSGKSTVAKAVAEELGYLYVDTGAMYRAITYAALKNNVVDDAAEVIKIAQNADLSLKFENGLTRVFLNGEEVTDKIRSMEVSSKVSEVSVIPEVREQLVKIQREMSSNNSLVAEGRDVTTVVFPKAEVKIFLTATLNERSERRYKEFIEQNKNISFEVVRNNISKRDRIDSSRDTSPLTKAEDAIEIDSTSMSIEEEIKLILSKVDEIRDKIKQEKISHHN
ncbi:MAG: (d)CMP kinase [Ignavibacteriae bacterium]|nr:(d)CMP kinase [Ignavibacteriota bacterium]NOG97325.1 (d)CMP kinase [Ignavibacteriota bacterium]